MAKEKPIELTGEVVEVKPNAMFTVEVDIGDSTHRLLATLSGKMRVNLIRVLLGDTVKVDVSPYDLSRGRIIFREGVGFNSPDKNKNKNKNNKKKG